MEEIAADGMPEDELAHLEFEPEFSGPIDMTAMLTRRFAWDSLPCSFVPTLLEALGLPLGTPEGMHIDHQESHERMAQVFFMEPQLQAYAHVLSAVLTKAILMVKDVEVPEEAETGFCEQNGQLILSAARAMIGQLIYSGVLQAGPMAEQLRVIIVEGDADV